VAPLLRRRDGMSADFRNHTVDLAMTRIAVTGKGGVGKTTLAALICRSFRNAGHRVLAVDADPDANLAATLGFPEPDEITPVSGLKDLIAERTGAPPGGGGVFFRLNPRVDDIPERFGVSWDGIRLLVMGGIKKAGTGCYCPENAFIRELVGHLLLAEKDVVVLDMEAGIEHLGRGTAGDVNAFVVVVEPGKRSIETAERIVGLASELGVKRRYIVVNKVRGEEDLAFVERHTACGTVIGTVPFSEEIVLCGRGDDGVRLSDMSVIDAIRDRLIRGAADERE